MNILTLKDDQMLGKKPFIEPQDDIYIAGGAIRQWFVKSEQETDIDVFGKNLDSLNLFEKTIINDYLLVSENAMTKTFKKENKIVQIIRGRVYSNIQELFDSFDFTCCQFAWSKDGIYTTSDAIISTLRNHLSIHKINPNFAIDSLRRAFKYNNKGFKPCWGTLRDLASSFQTITPEQLKNQVEISPNGGSRVVRFD